MKTKEKLHNNKIEYCKCEKPKPPSMNRCICADCGFVIPLDKQ